MPEFLPNLLRFGRLLRAGGLDVPVGRMLDLTEALTHVDVESRDDVFHTCRTLLVHRPDQLAIFERAFDTFWTGVRGGAVAASPSPSRGDAVGGATGAVLQASVPRADEREDDEAASGAMRAWSDAGGFAHKDFAELSAEEVARGRDALDGLTWTPGLRRTRRWAPGRGPRVDVRRLLARGVRTGGDVFTLPTRRRRQRPRPLVVLCDVSGSMDRYSRLLLHFAYGLTERHARVEAFLFATRLTRVTRQLRRRRANDALTGVAREATDWAGGTRIGPALEQFHRQWARRVLGRGAVVLLISDGWDCGDPDLLGEQVARLQRSCHRLIWLNPLIGTEGYEPLTRGLQAALPFIDAFLPARTLADLGDLAVHLNDLEPRVGTARKTERRRALMTTARCTS